mmetsp:Transcript_5427/g.12812  ORF Transcript_5427/g.12812 Transcript_5427/m.12812 type:complete len:209 (+) Transcript_5427:1135-1761(+)
MTNKTMKMKTKMPNLRPMNSAKHWSKRMLLPWTNLARMRTEMAKTITNTMKMETLGDNTLMLTETLSTMMSKMQRMRSKSAWPSKERTVITPLLSREDQHCMITPTPRTLRAMTSGTGILERKVKMTRFLEIRVEMVFGARPETRFTTWPMNMVSAPPKCGPLLPPPFCLASWLFCFSFDCAAWARKRPSFRWTRAKMPSPVADGNLW